MKNSNDLPMAWVEKIFMRLHGRFGNAFLDKFRIGKVNANGEDVGIENAKLVWSEELAGKSVDQIKNALIASYEYAPSCDDFKANCVFKAEIKEFKTLERKFTDEEMQANKIKIAQISETLAKESNARFTRIVFSRDWIKHWECVLANNTNFTANKFAKQALVKLGAIQAINIIDHLNSPTKHH